MRGRINRTAASIVDQAAVSGGNFMTTLVLARILAPAQYGVFSLLFLSLFAINTCHSSLVIYPLTLRGAAAPAELERLTWVALIHTVLLAAPLASLLALTTFLLHQTSLWPVMTIAMITWQMQETTRRALLSVLRFRSAILPDVLCYVGQGCVLAAIRPHSLSNIFWVVAATSLIAAIWQFGLTAAWKAPQASGTLDYVRTHGSYAWRMGRYILAGNALNMITLQIPAWTLALAFTPNAVAGYQSLLNLVGIANPIMFSINSMLIPAVAREAAHGFRRARQTATYYGLRYAVLLAPPFAVMMSVPHLVMQLVYGPSSPYAILSPLLRIFVVAFMLQYVATVVGAYEGGMSRPKTYMWVQVTGTGVLLTLGVAMIYRYGIPGAVAAMLVASVVRLSTVLFVACKADKQTKAVVPYVRKSLMEPYS